MIWARMSHQMMTILNRACEFLATKVFNVLNHCLGPRHLEAAREEMDKVLEEHGFKSDFKARLKETEAQLTKLESLSAMSDTEFGITIVDDDE